VQDYFDWLVLLNVRVIAQGHVGDVYTAENLQKAYGGRVALLQSKRFADARGPDAPRTVHRP
jgi:manganese/zinc/iron transport system ATP- binding protein